MATDCELTDVSTIKNINNAVTISPNPISTNTTITLNNLSAVSNYKLKIYNVLGNEIISVVLKQHSTQLDTHDLKTGIYFYKLMSNDQLIQSGKLISKQL